MTRPILVGATLFLCVSICHADRKVLVNRCVDSYAANMENLQNTGVQFYLSVVQWNLKDHGVTEEGNSAILKITLANAMIHDPAIFVFVYQENLSPGQTDAWLKDHGLPTGYTLLDHHWRHAGFHNMEKFHGSSGIMVFQRINGDIQAGQAYQSGTHHLITGQNDEKGMSAIPVTMGDRKFCFGAAHLDTGGWNTPENTRVQNFDKYATILTSGGEDCQKDKYCPACDAAWFGGDFNWRNGGWKKTTEVGIAKENGKGVHSHFTAEGVKEYFASLSVPQGFYQAEHSGTNDLPTVLVTNDERKLRQGGWLEGTAEESTELLNYPPTFQPAVCPPGGVDDNLAGIKTTVVDGDKDPVCFKTKSGGNCGNAICMSGQRPLAFTDAIYHKTLSDVQISSIHYGPIFMPLASDHFPMVGIWSVAHS